MSHSNASNFSDIYNKQGESALFKGRRIVIIECRISDITSISEATIANGQAIAMNNSLVENLKSGRNEAIYAEVRLDVFDVEMRVIVNGPAGT